MTAALLTIDALGVRVPVGTWTIDPAHSFIGFSVRHLMGKVRGTFEEFTGHLTTAKEPTDCSASATISMSSRSGGRTTALAPPKVRRSSATRAPFSWTSTPCGDPDPDSPVARHRDCFPGYGRTLSRSRYSA